VQEQMALNPRKAFAVRTPNLEDATIDDGPMKSGDSMG
jgi:hypothetical protein